MENSEGRFNPGQSENSEPQKRYTGEDFNRDLENMDYETIKQYESVIADYESKGNVEGAERVKKEKMKKEQNLKMEDKNDKILDRVSNMQTNIARAMRGTLDEWGMIWASQKMSKSYADRNPAVKTPEEWFEKFSRDVNEVLDSLGVREEFDEYIKAVQESHIAEEGLKSTDEVLSELGLKDEWDSYTSNENNKNALNLNPHRLIEWAARRHFAPALLKIYIAMRNKGWNHREISQ